MSRRSAFIPTAIASGVFIGAAALAFAQRITTLVPDVARPLPLTAVRLAGGPLKHAQDLNARYLLELEPDRMLAYYRRRAGLEGKAEPYGGWDGDGRNLTGHIAGHYLSAVSLMWAATGDERFKQRADYIVQELRIVQDKHGDGYLGAIQNGKDTFTEVAKGNIRSSGFDLNGQWAPWYTLHKTYAGLRDAYRFAGNKTALDVEIKYAEWAAGMLAHMNDEQVQRMLNTEFGGMGEILADLYADTGDKRWLDLSRRFEHRAVTDPLKRQQDNLAGLHGNTNVPKLIASADRYAYTGDKADGTAARFFWDRVVNQHTFATGGHGKDEYWREPDKLSAIVDGRTSESCNIYNMLKLTRRLFALEPDVKYAEFHERALFNHVLGSIDPDDGSTCYMVPVGRGVRREYANMQRSFTCCVGSGRESHALHADGIYYETDDKFWVNLFVPSTAEWNAAGVRVDAETDFPEGESASLRFTAEAPKAFTLAVRRPAWAGDGFAVRVNGETVKTLPKAGSYVEIKRTWKTGDAVTIALPKALHLLPTPDNPRRAAVMWGPLVLAGDLGPEPQRPQGRGGQQTAQSQPQAPRPAPVDVPMLVAADKPLEQWLKPADKPGTFKSIGVGRGRDVEFVPFYRLHRRIYAAYWDFFTPAEYDTKKVEIEAEAARQRALEAATVAFLRTGEMQPERDFNQQGENTSISRPVHGRTGRLGSGWFSFDFPVEPGRPMALSVTYHADSRRPRSFEILVDGRRITEQRFEISSEDRFFDVQYPIPADLIAGKERVTVRFQATSGNEIAAVFGIRMIRADGNSFRPRHP
jgi:DUF1680 family protein